jgi:hypothetical protein
MNRSDNANEHWKDSVTVLTCDNCTVESMEIMHPQILRSRPDLGW